MEQRKGEAFMYHIAVVEDDKMYAAQLREYLMRYEIEKKQKISVTMFSDGEDIVTDYSADFDIILMDIEMTFMDGMSAAEKIREMDSEVIIIFITNMPQYAIQGYRVDALDYVLKPLSYFAFTQRIDRALSRIHKKAARFVAISLKGGKNFLKLRPFARALQTFLRAHHLTVFLKKDFIVVFVFFHFHILPCK